MSDIVERLRAPVMVTAHNASGTGFDRYEAEPSSTDIEAADEIERLRTERDGLRSLLKEAGDALERLTTYATAPFDPFEAPDSNDWADAWDQSRTVLSKIKR